MRYDTRGSAAREMPRGLTEPDTMTTERLPLSVCMIAGAEAHRIRRSLESVAGWAGEIIVVINEEVTDGTDRIAASYGARVFREPWKGYAAQKNSAIDKAAGEWILSLDADEEVEPALTQEISDIFPAIPPTRHEILAAAKIPGPGMTREDVREAMKIARASGTRSTTMRH